MWHRNSDITAIPKSSEVGQGIDSSRPIGLMEVLGKNGMSFLDKQVTQIWQDRRVLSPFQFGFQRRSGVAEAARMVFDAVQFARATGRDLWAALSDVRTAVPSVPAWEWRMAYRRVRLPGWVQGCYNFNESRCKPGSAQPTVIVILTTSLKLAQSKGPRIRRRSSCATSMRCSSCYLTTEGCVHGIQVT